MSFIDSLDNILTNAKARRQYSSGAKAFARSVKPGRPYYTIKTNHGPWGTEQYLDVHVFTEKRDFVTGLIADAEGIYLACGGKVYDDRNSGPCRGLRTLRELTDDRNRGDGPDIRGNLNDYSRHSARR